jgi:hypothetical protein
MSGLIAVSLGLTLSPAASAGTGITQDPVPIGPNQFFRGFINNAPPGAAIIKVACPVGSSTGTPIANQPIEVKTAPGTSTTDTGFTGANGKKITADLTPSTATFVLATFTSYFVVKHIPTNVLVPCSGSGTVLFVPSPTSGTAVTARLPVTFANITR